jgi:hypothetical protein
MILADVMDDVAERLDTIPDLQVYAYPPGTVRPPAAVVAYPEDIVFDATYGRGVDTMRLPVVLVVGKPSNRSARAEVSAYASGAGARSVKSVLEANLDTYTAFEELRVARVEFDVVTIAGTEYLAALFDLQIMGSGE